MDGSDMAFDYKAVAAGIARSEGMGALLPVVEKELLHYRILSAMQDGGFFGPIVFQGGTSLRLCHGSPRYSEDLDFAGGTGFGVDDLRGLGECVRSSLAGMSPDVQVKVREPVRDEGLVRRWRISIRTAAQRRDLPSQSIKLEVASVPAHEPQTRPVRVNYPSVSAIAGDIILAVESPTEILADKLLSFACSSHIRRRDLWDMCWLSSRADVDASRAFRMATLKAGEYGEVGEWEARAGRLREIPVGVVFGRLSGRDAKVPAGPNARRHRRIPLLARVRLAGGHRAVSSFRARMGVAVWLAGFRAADA